MARDLFNVPIFFIVFRETIEAGIIVSVLLSFVEQLMLTGRLSYKPVSSNEHVGHHSPPQTPGFEDSKDHKTLPQENEMDASSSIDDEARVKGIVRRMRIQIWAGVLVGFFIALAIGAAFIAVFYTQVRDLWANTEQIWEGVFSIIAAIIIFVMGLAFLRMDRSRIKWRYKLAAAFDKSQAKALGSLNEEDRNEGRGGKWALFLLPLITVMREGLEAIVFVGGVSLNVTAASIPIAVIVGLIAGIVVAYIIYRTGSTTTLHWFLIGSTTFIFLIGAGLASKGVGYFQYYVFAKGVGGDVAETGDGPGSFQVKGNVWHLTYGNPETGSPTTNGGWQIFNAIFGWNNTATLGSILTYVFFWIAVIAVLIFMKWQEGRVSFFGKRSQAAHRMEAARVARNERLAQHTHVAESS
ncbi:hypothetical protein TREMEDRAFT_42374 [Tremella mesenterica DSM 1558]|uniref:uncharacterized protein n=1 Tax=Tremella mesenterica (strain ATCC 24925 / CBS 8224 / DSM 1558 / NBRC 9311 / NRRL Y-6157 / RJB 2259-6 / UBC 559-6) TaxID=578456 RepID=UPI0003F49ACE|nr:uncharacterized protein TREMEDRAFT_42374 [Tremella mesenterica DSM 1558]EIW73487.1 hypothetical protein TREMEDRAFT_42374 [Tremella mesenterica DSM 1558]